MKTKCYRKLLETAFTVNLLPVSLVKKGFEHGCCLDVKDPWKSVWKAIP